MCSGPMRLGALLLVQWQHESWRCDYSPGFKGEQAS